MRLSFQIIPSEIRLLILTFEIGSSYSIYRPPPAQAQAQLAQAHAHAQLDPPLRPELEFRSELDVAGCGFVVPRTAEVNVFTVPIVSREKFFTEVVMERAKSAPGNVGAEIVPPPDPPTFAGVTVEVPPLGW